MNICIDEAIATLPQPGFMPGKHLPASVLAEFRQSAVPDRLTFVNVSWVDGEEAVLLLAEEAMHQAQKVTTYITKAAASVLDRYKFAAAGGWVSYGTCLTYEYLPVAHFKPSRPRKSVEPRGFGKPDKVKVIKYETPAKCPALPILPYVDEESAQIIYTRYNFEPLEGESFWEAVQRTDTPIAITEGLKKALAVIAHGIPAIAVRGRTQWRTTGTDELHSIIAQLAMPGRTVFIAFDQDEKLKTQIDTRKQATKLGIALAKYGCKPKYLIWDKSLGKGIDDVLYCQGVNAQAWMDVALLDARDLHQYRKEGMQSAALETIRRLSASSFPIERFTEGEYIPELPCLQQGTLHVLNANMNAGKTTRIGRDWITEVRQRGWFTIVLAPLNSLGEQTAEVWGFPHIHDFETTPEHQRLLWSQANQSQGIVMCPDSLHRLPNWVLDRPVLFVLDEGNQVIKHLVEGNTLGDRWSDIVDRFGTIALHAARTGAIVLSEDGLPDRAINFIQRVSCTSTVRIFRHFKRSATWDCTTMSGHVSGFRGKLLQAAQRGDRILFVTTSQQECRRLERVLKNVASHLRVVRIDSQTNQCGAFREFFKNPDKWIENNQPDVLILSPSVKSGVSIQGNVDAKDAYFKSVWGYFPSLDTASQMQLLGRYRPAVPRFTFVPPLILASGDESLYKPRAIVRKLQYNAQVMNQIYGIAPLLDKERNEHHLALEAAVQEYLATEQSISGAQKMIARDALIDRLQIAGHCVKTERVTTCSEITQLWNQAGNEIWWEDSEEGASAAVDPAIHTAEWAYAVNNALESTHIDRVLASKVLLRDEFPGIAFDTPQEWYEAIYKDYGTMRRGIRLQVRAENLESSKERDRAAVNSILTSDIRALHRLPKHHVKALILKKIGTLTLLDGKPYDDNDPRAVAVKREALYFAKEINYWLRLTITENQGVVDICNKLLRKFGLLVEKKEQFGDIKRRKVGRRGEQHWIYWFDPTPHSVRARLLDAARCKLSESVSTICNGDRNMYIQNVDTPPLFPPVSTDAEGRVSVGVPVNLTSSSHSLPNPADVGDYRYPISSMEDGFSA